MCYLCSYWKEHSEKRIYREREKKRKREKCNFIDIYFGTRIDLTRELHRYIFV